MSPIPAPVCNAANGLVIPEYACCSARPIASCAVPPCPAITPNGDPAPNLAPVSIASAPRWVLNACKAACATGERTCSVPAGSPVTGSKMVLVTKYLSGSWLKILSMSRIPVLSSNGVNSPIPAKAARSASR